MHLIHRHPPQFTERKRSKKKEERPATDLFFLSNDERQQQDISTWLNYRTFLNGLDMNGAGGDLTPGSHKEYNAPWLSNTP